jgi:hypothetical protein
MKPAALLLALAALTGCSRPPKPKAASMAADIVATVGTTAIPVEDFIAHATTRRAGDDPDSRKEVLEELISEASLAEQAHSQGLDNTPQYRRAVRQLLISQLEEKTLQPLLIAAETVTDAEVQIATKNIATQPSQTQRCYAWLLVKFSPAGRSEGLARLAAAQAKITATPQEITTAGFGRIAAEFSEDTDTRYQGGVIGWFTQKQLPSRLTAPLAVAAATLPTGQVSAVIDHPEGACLLLATAEKPVITQAIGALAQAQQVRYEIVQSRQKSIRQSFRASARQKAAVKINQPALSAAVIPALQNPELAEPRNIGN